jgi:hypothetical protein
MTDDPQMAPDTLPNSLAEAPPAPAGAPDVSAPITNVRAEIDALDLPGSGPTLEARRETIHLLYDYLRERGTARKSDFLELIDADYVGYSSPGSFWANCVRGRDSLQSLPGVEAPGKGRNTWRFRLE